MAQDFYVKEAWETQTAILGSQHYHAVTLLDQSGDVFSVANKRNTTDADIYLNKMNGNGTVTWQNTISNLLNISTTQNYGTDIKRDQQGNTYISGAYFNGSNYDLIVVKYNSSGTELWRQVYNGTGNLDDAAANFVLDASGNVYVTGASFGVNTMTDIVTLKINGSNGAIAWTARYDFNGKYEGGSQVRLDNQGNVFVGGSSAQNNFNADFVALKYNPSTGNLLQSRRQNTPLNGYDIAIGMEIDQNNNVYLYGTANYNVNKDIKLVSYDANLNINWIKYYDQAGLEDEAGGLTIDYSGNPIITGHTKNAQGELKMLTAKYNKTNGDLIWMEQHETTSELTASKGKKVKIDGDGNIITAGEVTLNGVSHVKLLSYDIDGNLRWEHVKKNTTLSDQQALDLIVNGNDIFLTGVEWVNNDPNLFTVKMQPKEIIVAPDFNGEPSVTSCALEVNQGQLLNDDFSSVANEVKFYNDKMNPAVFVTENTVALAFQQNQQDAIAVQRVNLDFIGSAPVKHLVNLKQDELAGMKNYYLYHQPEGIAGVREYSRVIMADVYPNIDVQYYSGKNGMKYYIDVKPGGDPQNIRLQFTGATNITLNQGGSLQVHSDFGFITFNNPIAYQLDANNNPVALNGQGAFIQVSSNVVVFDVKQFDHNKPLFIQIEQDGTNEDHTRNDNLKWATYYGGVNYDAFSDNTVDEQGDMYFTGSSNGLGFPRTTGNTFVYFTSSLRRIVIGKFKTGGLREWATLYGAEMDVANSIATDTYGNVFVTGVSSSSGYTNQGQTNYQNHFLTQAVGGAYNQAPVNPAQPSQSYAFLIKFNQNDGNRTWATVFGENTQFSSFNAQGISCDIEGNIFIAGRGKRMGTSPIVAVGAQYVNSDTGSDKSFIIKFNNLTNNIEWSTMFGNEGCNIRGIKAYGHGDLFITGITTGVWIDSDFPFIEEHPGADYFDNTYNGGSTDAFIARFSPGNALKYSTLIGGSGEDAALSVTRKGNASEFAIGGFTSSPAPSFPLVLIGNEYNPTDLASEQDAFLTVFKLGLEGYEMTYSTYWGQGNYDRINEVRYSKTGDLFAVGMSTSVDLDNILVDMDNAYNQDYLENDEVDGTHGNAFLIGFNTDYNYKWSTLFGGKPNADFNYSFCDQAHGVAIYYNRVYMVGSSSSQTNFPVREGVAGCYFQEMNGSGLSSQSDDNNYSDGFIAEFDLSGTDLGTTLGVEELSVQSVNGQYMMYPNPANDKVVILDKTNKKELEAIEILDISGKVVKKITNLQFMNSNAINFEVTDLPTGFYHVILKTANEAYSLKLVKQ
ncbi:MAG: T9SS type A sorting domain-containing protein [Bacteroidota bacterium]